MYLNFNKDEARKTRIWTMWCPGGVGGVGEINAEYQNLGAI